MFYSQFILAKTGPLGTIWIAAHLERKLRKNQVADTDIGDSVDSILFPDVPIALRLSSHLLLGVVRIYSRKVNYLFDDCSEALLKIKQAFRSTTLDLPPEQSKAPYHSITLPETFDLDDFELPDNDIFQGNYVDHHVSTREQITIQDNMMGIYTTSQFGLDERFGDGDTSQVGLDLEEDILLSKADVSEADPQASTEPAFCMETDANDDEMDASAQDMPVNGTRNKKEGLITTSETIEYAQAPSTPVLIGEPNLSSAQESLACDDNLESEYLITESGVEGTRKASGMMNHRHGDDVADLSSVAHLNHDTDECMVDKENGHPGRFQSTENIGGIPTNGIDGSQEDCSVKVEDVLNSDGKQSMPTKDLINGECVDSEDSRLHQTDEVKVGNETGQSHSENEAVNALEFPVPSELADAACQVLRDPEIPETSDSHFDGEQVPSNSVPVLRARNLQITRPEENQILEPMYNGQIHADDGMLDEDFDRAITTANQLENQNASEASELPEPEKLLSMRQRHSDNAEELLVELTEKDDMGEVDKSHDSNRLSGKKRNLPDSSLATPSLSLGESFGMTRSKKTMDLVPDDDDLLSSILVGRKSSVLKMKPTPALNEVSRKRSRPASRSNAAKRKVPMDDSMVLHGDTIRQQLINTEDIRRQRKKAPCTQIEVLLIQRQFLEEELFNEPVLTGVSEEITCLHNKKFDFSKVRIFENVDTNAPTELSNDKEFSSSPTAIQYTDMEVSTQPVVCGNGVARFDRTFTQTENHHEIDGTLGSPIACDLENINSNGKIVDRATVDHEALPCVNEMGTNGNMELADAANPSAVLRGDTSQTEPLCEEIFHLPTDSLTKLTLLNQNTDTDASLPMDGLARQSDTANPQTVNDSDTINIGKGVYDVGGVNNCSENIEKVETVSTADAGILSVETNTDRMAEPGTDGQVNTEQADAYHEILIGGCVDQKLVDVDQAQEYIGGDKLGVGNNDEDPSMKSLHDDKEQIPTDLWDEETRFDASCSAALDGNVEIASLADGGRPLFDQDRNIDAECTSFNHVAEGVQDFEFVNDTDFLNFDEGDADEEDNDEMPSAEDTRLLVNSGWSGRTRAVGKYLQTLFDDQVGHGRKALSVDNLLNGKTRKEAARMFFETLVLKTKDYIQVEQEKPFNNIVIKPTTKLMKSEF